MTILQLQYALNCATYRTITKSAEQLYTTPSNVSKILKGLEEELGYPIFVRTNKELVLTEKGEEFLRYASAMMQEYENMKNIGRPRAANASLTICCNQIPYVKYAFTELIKKHQNDPRIELGLYQGNFYYCINQLEKHSCQICLLALYSATEGVYLEEIKRNSLTAEKLAKSAIGLLLRTGHPLLKEIDDIGKLNSPDAVDWQKLRNYPYVSYQQITIQDEILSPFSLAGEKWPINPGKMIYANNMAMKCEFVRNTDAFTFSSSLYEHPHEERGIVFIPDQTATLNYYLVRQKKTAPTELEKDFLSCFKEELALRKHFH